MGDIFVAPVGACQAPWWRLTTRGQVSRGAAPPTGVFPVIRTLIEIPVIIRILIRIMEQIQIIIWIEVLILVRSIFLGKIKAGWETIYIPITISTSLLAKGLHLVSF